MGRCRPDRRGPPPPPLWCAWGTSAYSSFCPIVRAATRMIKKLQPCAWRHVAKRRSNGPGIVHATLY
eukprot:3208092-Prymnesium_polylepis.1